MKTMIAASVLALLMAGAARAEVTDAQPMHMTTVHAAPGQKLVLNGGLGPLQSSGASGAMTIVLAEKDGATTVTLTYDVGGYFKGGLDKLAAPVDGVLGQQVQGLKAVVEGR